MLLNILHKTGFFNLCRSVYKNKRSISILLHGTYGKTFRDIPHKLHFGMHTDDLEKMILWLKKENIPLISTTELLAGKPGLNISLDDGYANNYEYGLKVFEKMESPFTIFVTTRHIIENDRCDILDYFTEIIQEQKIAVSDEAGYELFWGLTPDQVKKLSVHPLAELGCHTHNHPHLNLCSENDINNEISLSSDILKNLTGEQPKTFSYPFGDYDQRTINSVIKKGFIAAFAVKPSLRNNTLFELPRIGIYNNSPAYLSAKLNFIYHSIRCA